MFEDIKIYPMVALSDIKSIPEHINGLIEDGYLPICTLKSEEDLQGVKNTLGNNFGTLLAVIFVISYKKSYEV